MHAFTKLTKDSVGGLTAGLGKGLHAVTSTVDHNSHSEDHQPAEPAPATPPTLLTTSPPSGPHVLTVDQSEVHQPPEPASTLLGSLTSTTTSGLGKGLHAVASTVGQGFQSQAHQSTEPSTAPADQSPEPASTLLGSLTSTTTSGLGKGLHAVASTVGQGFQSQAHQSTEPSTAPADQSPEPASTLLGSLTSTTTSGLGKGLHAVASTVGQGFQSQAHQSTEPSTAPVDQSPEPAPTLLGSLTSTTTSAASGLGKGLHAVASTVGQGFQSQAHQSTEPSTATPLPTLLGSLTSTTTAAAAVARSGATLAFSTTRDATAAGLSIGSSVARSGLDASANVVSLTAGTASLAGTALGAVVAAAADTSGAVFEPVASGLKTLKALEEFDHLQHGIDTINGLSLAAVKSVSELTTKALNVSGKTPTFFDPDADGVVRVPDTVRGLVLLGLGEKIATYAAYVLHTTFSYSTSDSWVPAFNKSLPIHVAKMTNTRWGTNWGNFERLQWISDVEIDKFFVVQKTFSDYWKLGRQGFGILLLLFEWGTTWPFYMPSLTVPISQIPFANDIGCVVRKAILPTIVSNFRKSLSLNPQPQAPRPVGKAPEETINMPGEFKG